MDYSVRLSGQDNLSGTIKQCKQSVEDFGKVATTQMDKFRQRFDKIQNSAAPLKRQLRDLKAIMSEMNFKGLSGTEEFTKIAMYAGQVKDAMDDAGAAAKRFSDDIFALRAAADAFTLITGATTALTGAMNLFGIKNEEVKNAILKVQSAMAVLNGVQAIANALNKDSALMQAMKALKLKIATEYTKLNTKETTLNTISEVANTTATNADAAAKTRAAVATGAETAATKGSTIAQNAWNMAKAVGKALLGDFTGLAIVAAGGIATMAMAMSSSTDEIDDNTRALDENTQKMLDNVDALKVYESWSHKVGESVGDLMATYTLLQERWKECNGDVKLQGEFMKKYKGEIDSLRLGINDLVKAENAFVKYTDVVVAAILARAKAEAGKEQYKETYKNWMNERFNPTYENGGKVRVANVGDKIDKDLAKQLGLENGKGFKVKAYTGTNVTWLALDDYGRKVLQAKYFKDAASIRESLDKAYKNRLDEIQEQYIKAPMLEAEQLLKSIGFQETYSDATSGHKPYSGYGNKNKNRKPGKHGSSSKGGSGGSDSEKKSDREILKEYAELITRMEFDLEHGNVQEGKEDEFRKKLDKIKEGYKKLAEAMGEARLESIKFKEEQVRIMEEDLEEGRVTSPIDIQNYKSTISRLKQEIKDEKIELGLEDLEYTTGSLKALEDKITDLQDKLRNGFIPERDIENTKKQIEDLTKKKWEMEVKLGFEEAPRTDFEKNLHADKYKGDWDALTKYMSDYKARAEQYRRNLKKYEDDMATYNAAQKKYVEDLKKYEESLKRYNKYKKQIEKESKQQEEAFDNLGDDAVESSAKARKLNEGLAELDQQLKDNIITLDEYNAKVEELFANQSQLREVIVQANKPMKPIKPQLELPKKPFNPLKSASLEEIFGDALDNIPEHINQLMDYVQEQLDRDDLSVDVRIEWNIVKQKLQDKLDNITRGEFVIKPVVQPEYFKTGTADWLSQNYMNAEAQVQRIQDHYNQGIIKSSSEAKRQIAEINAELVKLGMKPIVVEIKTKGQEVLESAQLYLSAFSEAVVGTVDSIDRLVTSIDEGASGWEIFKNALSTAEQIMTSITTIMSIMNTLQDAHNVSKAVGNAVDQQSAVNKEVEAAANTAIAATSPAVAAAIETQAGIAAAAIAPLKMLASTTTELAAAQMFAAHASIPFAGAAIGAAQVGIMMGTLAALKALDKFAGGGIVGGNSYHGDQLVARVNSGEMILNNRQQRNLFNAINRGDIGGNNAQSISFRIKGSDLYGTLRNYQKIKGKSVI